MQFIKVSATQADQNGQTRLHTGPMTFYLNVDKVAAISGQGKIMMAGDKDLVMLDGQYFKDLRVVEFTKVIPNLIE